MAKYSIELRKIIETVGEDEVRSWFMDYDLTNYLTADEIAVIEERGTWNKQRLAQKIIDHYYMEEIGVETVGLFKRRAKVAMQEIMEEKLPLIYSVAIKYDPLVNVDYTETYQGNSTMESSSTGSASSNSSSLTVNSDTPQGQINKADILGGSYASSTSADDIEDSSSSSSEGSNTGSNDYEKRIRGNSGVSATAQKMVEQYRENIVMIDRDIIQDLRKLFMSIYQYNLIRKEKKMDQNNNIKFTPPVPPFLGFCSASIPTAFDDSLSYYEALCALYRYLKDNIVNVINNNATVTEYYIQLVKDLKSYVENYFDNLDVQEEINNKLDAMVEDGTFDEIINHELFDELQAEVNNKLDKNQPQFGGNLDFERYGRLVDETFSVNSEANGYFGMQGGVAIDEDTFVFLSGHHSDNSTYADELNLIRKVKLSTGEILSSKTVALGHGNGMCYDASNSKYYVAPAHGNVNQSSYSNTIITLDSNLNFVQSDVVAENFDSLSIDENGDLYAGITYKPDGVVVYKLDKTDFSIVETINLSMPVPDTIGTGQDIAVRNGYIYFLQYRPNAIFVFDMEGNNIQNYTLNDNMFYALGEPENITAFDDGTLVIGSTKQPTGNLYTFENIVRVNPVKGIEIQESSRLYDQYNDPLNVANEYVDPDSTAFAPDGSSEKPFKCIDEVTAIKLKNPINIVLTNNKTYYVNRINSFDGTFDQSSGVTFSCGLNDTILRIRNSNIYFNYVAELPSILVDRNSNCYFYHNNFNHSGAGYLVTSQNGSIVTLENTTIGVNANLSNYLFVCSHATFIYGAGNKNMTSSGLSAITKWFKGYITFKVPFPIFNGTMTKTDTLSINNGSNDVFKTLNVRFNDYAECVIPSKKNDTFSEVLVNLSASGTGQNSFRNVNLKMTDGVLSIDKAVEMKIASTTGEVTMDTDPTVNIVRVEAW